MQKIFIGLIDVYRYFVSPILGQHCRFIPSCSEFAYQAITQHGAWWGIRLSITRVLHCHPWHVGGYDPVPKVLNKKKVA